MKWAKRQAEIDALRAKHGRDRSLARTPPDLSVKRTYPSLTDGFAPITYRRTGGQHPDAKQFPVGNCHKQGPQLITEDVIREGGLKWMSGKKS